ncbi:MAG: translation elongation factor Ts [Myxococcales bacterium]|nr:translation elongation factor Ts [Myxococcales bacterium]
MPEINANMVKELRDKTGAGMMDCKKALAESAGDFAKAEEWLRKKGITKAEAKVGRIAAEGLIGSYIHHGGKIGVIVEVNCETDFVARNQDFQQLVKDLAMHIAAASPRWVRREEVSADTLEKEKEIYLHELREQKKPEQIWEKILGGKLEKFYETVCLLDQYWVKDDKKRIKDLVTEQVAKIGENISIRRFARFQVGEGIEKRKDNLAEEVAKAMAGANGKQG